MDTRQQAYEYCANEFYAGYPCGTEGCPTCGGQQQPETNMSSITELACFPSTRSEAISAFVQGVDATLSHMPNPTGNDPMKVEPEFRVSGNCHIWLVTGRWMEVDGEVCEVYPSMEECLKESRS